MNIAAALAFARCARKMSQPEAARKVGVPLWRLQVWERDGHKHLGDLTKVADAYEMPISHLFWIAENIDHISELISGTVEKNIRGLA